MKSRLSESFSHESYYSLTFLPSFARGTISRNCLCGMNERGVRIRRPRFLTATIVITTVLRVASFLIFLLLLFFCLCFLGLMLLLSDLGLPMPISVLVSLKAIFTRMELFKTLSLQCSICSCLYEVFPILILLT